LRGRQLIEYPLCFLLKAKIACDQGQTRAPSRGFRVFGDKLPNERSNLGEAPLLAASGKHLHAIDAGCDLALKLARNLERSFRQALSCREIAVQNRAHRIGAGYYILVIVGKLSFVQQLLSALEVRLEVGQIADFKRSHGGDISNIEITETDLGIQTSIAKLIDHLTQLGDQPPAL
jgi:hypothetical protein